MTLQQAFTLMGQRIAGAGLGTYADYDRDSYLDTWLEEAPFYRVVPDPTDSDGIGRVTLCMFCGREPDDRRDVSMCPNHAIDAIAEAVR